MVQVSSCISRHLVLLQTCTVLPVSIAQSEQAHSVYRPHTTHGSPHLCHVPSGYLMPHEPSSLCVLTNVSASSSVGKVSSGCSLPPYPKKYCIAPRRTIVSVPPTIWTSR